MFIKAGGKLFVLDFWIDLLFEVIIAASLKSPGPSDCKIGVTGAAALAAALEKNTTLLQLNLKGVFVISCFVEAGYGLLLFEGRTGLFSCIDSF